MSVEFRKDKRNLEVFKDNIKDFTQRESLWGVVFKEDLNEKGWVCSIGEYGVDNSGSFIDGTLKNFNADKILKFCNNKKEILLEIKTIPEYLKDFFTFKVSSLKNCLNQNAYVLVPRSNGYYCIGRLGLIYFLKNYSHKIYKGFSPNDLAVRIPTKDMDKLIEQKKIVRKEWSIKAKKIIKDNWDVLFRDKRI